MTGPRLPRIFLLTLILLAAPLSAQETAKDLLMKAQFAEFRGELTLATKLLTTVMAADDAEAADLARLRLAAIHRQQGYEAKVKEVLIRLTGRPDAIGASARRMLALADPSLADATMSPVYRLIADLDQGDSSSHQEVQTAIASLHSLGALVVPALIERFSSLGIFGRRNAIEFLIDYEQDLSVQSLLEAVIREDRSGEARLFLNWMNRSWETPKNLIPIAVWGLKSRDELARHQAFEILAYHVEVDDPPQILSLCRTAYDKILQDAIAEQGDGPNSDRAEAFADLMIFSKAPDLPRFLELRVPYSVGGWAARLWLDRLGPNEADRFNAMLAQLDGHPYFEFLKANANSQHSYVSGLKAGLRYYDTTSICLQKCNALGIEITQDDWAAIAASPYTSTDNTFWAFTHLGDHASAPAQSRALQLVLGEGQNQAAPAGYRDWNQASEAALRYLIRVSPTQLLERIDQILDDKRAKQVLIESLGEEPSPNKAKIALRILRKGGHFDQRLLMVVAIGSGPTNLEELLAMVSVPIQGLDQDVWPDFLKAWQSAMKRAVRDEDLPQLLKAHREMQYQAAERLSTCINGIDRADKLTLLSAEFLQLVEPFKVLGNNKKDPSLTTSPDDRGAPIWQSRQDLPLDQAMQVARWLRAVGPESVNTLRVVIFGNYGAVLRGQVLYLALQKHDGFDRRLLLANVLKDERRNEVDFFKDEDLLISDARLRQAFRAWILTMSRSYSVKNFLERLPDDEKRETCIQILKTSPFKEGAKMDHLGVSALEVLGKMKTRDDSLIPLYVEFLPTPVGWLAAQNLGQLYSKKAIPELISALEVENSQTRITAREWLTHLETHFAEQKRWQKLLEETQEDPK